MSNVFEDNDKVYRKKCEIIGALKYLYSAEFAFNRGGTYADLVYYRDNRIRVLMDELNELEKECDKWRF